jgi:hypothetical protein
MIFETDEETSFLNFFTLEYINFLDENNIEYPNLSNSKLLLSKNDVENILLKVKKRM